MSFKPQGILTRRQSKSKQAKTVQETPKASKTKESKQNTHEPTQQPKTMSKTKRNMHAKTIETANNVVKSDQFKDLEAIQIEDRLQLTEEAWQKFQVEHEAYVDAIDAAQVEPEFMEYERVMELYLMVRSAFRSRIEALKPKLQAQPAADRPIQITVKQNEKEIANTWGTFGGDCLKWPGFRERFKVIHANADLAATQKFDYLQKALKGEAARIRGDLDITEQNYNIIWDRLIERYEDDYLIIHTLIQKITKMQPLQKATSYGLRRILDTIRDALGQLEAYFDTKAWYPILTFIVLDLLDTVTLREWEKLRPSLEQEDMETDQSNAEGAVGGDAQPQQKRKNGMPSWKQLESFIEQQAKYLGNIESSSKSDNLPRKADAREANASRERNQDRGQKRGTQQNQNAEQKIVPNGSCHLCSGPHWLYKCEKWLLEMSLTGRKDYILAHNLCHICLQASHGETDCFPPRRNKPCNKCFPDRRFHNSTLCPVGDRDRATTSINQASLGGVQASTGARSKNQSSA